MTGFWRGCAIAALLVSVSACDVRFGRPNDDNKAKAEKEQPVLVIPVEAQYPERGSISAYLDTQGYVHAEQNTAILTQGAGPCIEVLAEEGDRVEKDQVLAQIKTDEAKASLNNIQQQVFQNKQTYDRAKELFEAGLGPEETMDNARHSYQASLAQLKQQQLQLDNLTIRAPFAGVITLRGIQAGMIVPSAHIAFNIIDPETFMLAIFVAEQHLSGLREGQVAEVTVDAVGDEIFEAAVRRINPGIDENGFVKVVLDFDESARPRLRESAYARIKLVMETHDGALLLAKESIIGENSRKYVFILRPEAAGREEIDPAAEAGSADTRYTAERVEITTGLEDSRYTEILSGIEDSDLIVTNGHFNLKPGATVRVTNVEAELMSQAGLAPAEALANAQAEAEKSTGEGPNGGEKMRHRY